MVSPRRINGKARTAAGIHIGDVTIIKNVSIGDDPDPEFDELEPDDQLSRFLSVSGRGFPLMIWSIS